MKGQILLISGPSGSGKSTLINRLMKEEKDIYFSISCTTREIRQGEKDGVDYYFLSVDGFKKGIENGEFLEWALVHKNYYGTSLKPVLEAFEDDKIVIFDIDVQGFDIVRGIFPDEITSVFLTTKNSDELRKRLEDRNTNTLDDIARRLENAVGEMSHIKDYDYLLINDDLEKAYQNLKSIFKSIKCNTKNLNLTEFIDNW
ncbi:MULTISPECIES: guanylate kinase [unclassified Campylobacter]|uniref:guanylate kinase n=1 Tax=unclassified Campylobacter TaxID=2593542 RepID=UPI0022E9B5C9|nr:MULTISPECIES: guanylate kinase [unclassified Campylobacter]MDA3079572.1 guanylate kinase [Campylobacter sp. CS_NA2]MDA3080996.1 guanylate kinase [Campylobacter sp. CS_NA1]MDA3085547.1 guanylate kinase [Campylobacter sp. CS_ED1]MDA3090405.1 guanylate kinase [Campylobacter sp. CS_ED2]WBR50813.1 guanylate kinase [Campylobacter sp. CS_NA3]